VAHQANGLAKNAGEHMEDTNCWAEAVYKSPIRIAIFLKGNLSLSK
jgi:hypothetical protein